MAIAKALELAGRVNAALEQQGVRPVVIGAVALAAHGYVRGTEDVDLGIAVHPKQLEGLTQALRTSLSDVTVELSLPDGNDPLGGVLDIERQGIGGVQLVQVVNFDNSPAGGFPALVQDAETAPFPFPEGQEGRLVSLEYLVLFKLYAGGNKSRADIEELLARRKVDVPRLEQLARKYGLAPDLARVLDPGE